MQFVCDTPDGKTWFRIETEAEAARESRLMNHAVEKYFCRERDKAVQSYQPASSTFFERDIGLKAHILREMPLFLTLRDGDGHGLATAMLPPRGDDAASFTPIVVGPRNADPYPAHGEAIAALGRHYGIALEPERCYPYRRG